MTVIKRTSPREIKITKDINPYAAGSVLVEFGSTKVHVTAVVSNSVPPFLKGKGKGWITAEYSMLPSSTHQRVDRERKGAGGRTQEIQRLIGRSLRSAIDLDILGERTIQIDCDVLVADGGTRTASITGAYVALELAIKKIILEKIIDRNPLKDAIAAISVGIDSEGNIIADLNYSEDSTCNTDMNIVMTKSGRFVEIQGTAEGEPFNIDQLNSLISCARESLGKIFLAQDNVLGE